MMWRKIRLQSHSWWLARVFQASQLVDWGLAVQPHPVALWDWGEIFATVLWDLLIFHETWAPFLTLLSSLAGVGLAIMRGTWMCFFEMSMHSTEECEWPGKWLRNFCNISGKEYPLETDKSCSADSPRCASTLRRHWRDTDELHCNPIFDSALRTNGLFEAVLCRAPSL